MPNTISNTMSDTNSDTISEMACPTGVEAAMNINIVQLLEVQMTGMIDATVDELRRADPSVNMLGMTANIYRDLAFNFQEKARVTDILASGSNHSSGSDDQKRTAGN